MQKWNAALCIVALAPSSTFATDACTAGAARIETFQSSILNRVQTLRIWLPEGYDSAANSQRRYPVLYLFDGQDILSACVENAWLPVDETVPGLIRDRKIGPIIIIGIDSGNRRSHEYLPYSNPFEEPGAEPAGRSIPQFMLQEVIPHVQKYRITTNPGETGIGGVSNGAVAALHVLIEPPEIFGLGLIESPMLHDGNGRLVRDASFLARGPDRVYVGIGTAETSIPGGEQLARNLRISEADANKGLVKLAEKLVDNLRNSAFKPPQIRFVKDSRARHDAEYWRRRFPQALVFLFGRSLPDTK